MFELKQIGWKLHCSYFPAFTGRLKCTLWCFCCISIFSNVLFFNQSALSVEHFSSCILKICKCMTVVLALSFQSEDFSELQKITWKWASGLSYVLELLFPFRCPSQLPAGLCLSCPSTAILGQLSKLQVQFGLSCNRKYHPCKLWSMPGAVSTPLQRLPKWAPPMLGALRSAVQVVPISVMFLWRKGTLFQRPLCYVWTSLKRV